MLDPAVTTPVVVVLNIDPSMFYSAVGGVGTTCVLAALKRWRVIVKHCCDFGLFLVSERYRVRKRLHEMAEEDRRLRVP